MQKAPDTPIQWTLFLVFFGMAILWGRGLLAEAEQPSDQQVRFNRDIRPILSNKCFQCHGPDEHQRQAGLRLDQFQGATALLDSGNRAIVPGDPEASQLMERVNSHDEFVVMPPPEVGKQVTPQEASLLKRWIEQGAGYEGHWAFLAPQRPSIPAVQQASWPKTPIDHFILRRLEAAGLKPAAQADRRTLIRRATFDLTGLPPTPEEVMSFVNDPDPHAYEKLVDRLLASPRYGEHQARYWLDAARYGDTHGLHLDNYREMWPYRDWVIQAFNDNKPFDEFTIEQLAGDLLTDPTQQQLIASGFNRCNVTTSEGGSIAEEVLVRYAVDRVETTSTVFLGLTAGCAACHNHKFDPISQKEFYQLFAFFNSINENAMDGNKKDPRPIIRVSNPQDQAEELQLQMQLIQFKGQIQEKLAKVDYVDPGPQADADSRAREVVWIEDAAPSNVKLLGNAPIWQWVSGPKHPVKNGQRSLRRSAKGLTQDVFENAAKPLVVGQGDVLFAHVYVDPADPPAEIMLQFNSGGWLHRAYWGANQIAWGTDNTSERRAMGPLPPAGQWVRLEVPARRVGLKPGTKIFGWAFTQFDGTVYWDSAGIETTLPQPGQTFVSKTAWENAQQRAGLSGLPTTIEAILRTPLEKRTDDRKRELLAYFLHNAYAGKDQQLKLIRQQIATAQEQLGQIRARASVTTLVSQEMSQPRPAYVLERGDYRRKKEQVSRGVPAIFPPLPQGQPTDRLALARWLVSAEHPLTARVTVNRIWQQYFGVGIVKTSEDFGSQGEWPTHPELLDWLATHFVGSHWDVKALHRLIITSAAYRQSSKVQPEKLAVDPDNRLISRGPRFRLDAEVIRDTALACSGLLVQDLGGPSVKPYQPPGLWRGVGYSSSNTAVFQRDQREKLYRRSVYTFWKRTSPPPGMVIFDAPSREACTVRRSRTNTPLQALNLMNDVQYVECARHMARRIITQGGKHPQDQARYAFLLATAREPSDDELAILMKVYRTCLAKFQQDKDAAMKLVSVGESKRDQSLHPAEYAAWTMVANLILNLDETITKS